MLECISHQREGAAWAGLYLLSFRSLGICTLGSPFRACSNILLSISLCTSNEVCRECKPGFAAINKYCWRTAISSQTSSLSRLQAINTMYIHIYMYIYSNRAVFQSQVQFGIHRELSFAFKPSFIAIAGRWGAAK